MRCARPPVLAGPARGGRLRVDRLRRGRARLRGPSGAAGGRHGLADPRGPAAVRLRHVAADGHCLARRGVRDARGHRLGRRVGVRGAAADPSGPHGQVGVRLPQRHRPHCGRSGHRRLPPDARVLPRRCARAAMATRRAPDRVGLRVRGPAHHADDAPRRAAPVRRHDGAGAEPSLRPGPGVGRPCGRAGRRRRHRVRPRPAGPAQPPLRRERGHPLAAAGHDLGRAGRRGQLGLCGACRPCSGSTGPRSASWCRRRCS